MKKFLVALLVITILSLLVLMLGFALTRGRAKVTPLVSAASTDAPAKVAQVRKRRPRKVSRKPKRECPPCPCDDTSREVTHIPDNAVAVSFEQTVQTESGARVLVTVTLAPAPTDPQTKGKDNAKD